MARSLKTLNPLAGYLVWSGSAWGGVGEAPDTRQAVCVANFACGEELNHLCTSSCFSMGTGSSEYVAVQPGVVCTRTVRVLHNLCDGLAPSKVSK